MNNDLPKNRLATTDSTGARVYLYPARVFGKYTSRKAIVHGGLMAIFLVLPWIHAGGQQLLLLDVARREFFFFGLHLRAHDAPLFLFFLLGFAFLIGLVSAIWGRLWCGWACPQTVFTEAVFRKIEAWVEGSPRERKALDEGPFTSDKLRKKAVKWGLFTLVSLLFTHSFLAYFVGSYPLLEMIQRSPTEHWESFLVILGTTAIILFDFGWFREQFCVIMCPYGRFQSVMLDSYSLVVGYDGKRGEPRRGTNSPGQTQGDCVDCFRCVQVCPTGIDIRRGLQMECIACTACIDACDEVMRKVRKPTGLIRYTTLRELAGRTGGRISARAIMFALLLTGAVGTLALTLGHKEFLEVTVLRAGGAPYEVLPLNDRRIVVNHFRVDLSNQTGRQAQLSFRLPEAQRARGIELVFPLNPLTLEDGATQRADFFVRFPPGETQNGSLKIPLLFQEDGRERETELSLVGPNA